jgi:hypothetical protein
MAYKLAREDIYEGKKIPIGFLQVYIFESKLSAKYVMKNYNSRSCLIGSLWARPKLIPLTE